MSNKQLIKSAHVWFLSLLLAAGFWVTTGNRNIEATAAAQATKLNASDHAFVMEAAMGGMMEVELGRVAAQKGTNDAVKQFGQRMVDDHSKANTDLMSVASNKDIKLPTELDAKHKAELTKFSNMSGTAFDRAYSKEMLDDHVKDVAAFEKESTKGTDADLKAFATRTLPTLQDHLKLAKALPGN